MKSNNFYAIVLIIFTLITACHEEPKSVSTETKVEKIENINFIKAKENADSVFYYVNKAVNLMTQSGLTAKSKKVKVIMAKADPFQKRLDSLKILLNPMQVKEIDEYRQTLLNKVQSEGF